MKTVRVYLAGPYTRPDPVENTHKAIKCADQLELLGYVVYVPHLSLFWHAVTPKPYQHWLDYDLEWIKVCHALFRMDGESSGADAEVLFAQRSGIPVVRTVAELQAECPLT